MGLVIDRVSSRMYKKFCMKKEQETEREGLVIYKNLQNLSKF